MLKTMTRWCLATVLATTIAACASTPKPLDEMSRSRNAVTQADTSDTREFAPMELISAKERQALAERAFDAGEYTQAKRYSEQAVVQAELAAAKAQANKSKLALQEVDGNIKTMQKEVDGGKPSIQLQ